VPCHSDDVAGKSRAACAGGEGRGTTETACAADERQTTVPPYVVSTQCHLSWGWVTVNVQCVFYFRQGCVILCPSVCYRVNISKTRKPEKLMKSPRSKYIRQVEAKMQVSIEALGVLEGQ